VNRGSLKSIEVGLLRRCKIPMFIKRIRAWLNIIRIGNSIALGVAAIVGYVVGGGTSIFNMIKVFLTAFFIGGGGNIVNDYFDRDIDAVNKPWRPIPMGLIKPEKAYIASLLFFFIGFLISVLSSYIGSVIALFAIFLVYMYSYRLKRILLIGNFVIAFLTALSIVYGSLFSSCNIHTILTATYAFLFNLGREFLKGIEDVEGDKKFNVKTLATEYGASTAFRASLAVYTILLTLSILPVLYLQYSLTYMIFALVVDVVIIYALMNAKSLEPSKALKSTRFLKIAAFAGLLAFLFHNI